MSRLKLFFLGPPLIELDGFTVKMNSRRAVALLAYLALTKGKHRRDSLINLFWPDYDQTRARTLLRRNFYILNKAIGSDWLERDDENIGLNTAADIWVDVDSFHDFLAECESHRHAPSEICPSCLQPLTKAAGLYKNDFLKGFSMKDSHNFDDWQFSQTQSLRSEMIRALERLGHCLREDGKYEKAITYAGRWLEMDRADEEAHRLLMESYAKTGRRSAALRQYEECVNILEKELGEAPQEETLKLYRAIKENAFSNEKVSPTGEASPTERGASMKRQVQLAKFPRDLPDPQRWEGKGVEKKPNLPLPPSPLIGREKELPELRELLLNENIRLTTLTGTGGSGKTLLALQVALDLVGVFEHDAYFVDLSPVRDPDLVVFIIAKTLGVREIGGQALFESLKEFIYKKHMLLLLDNFEQVVEAGPKLVELLGACPRLKILVTSREELMVRGEQVFRLSPLDLPKSDLNTTSLKELTRNEAVRLFVERAVSAKHDFTLTKENASTIARIVIRLDGLPLAIELAAARIRLFQPQDILSRLDDRFRLLADGSRDLPARQRSLQSTLDWSHDLLEKEDKVLFRRLAVFVGGCTLEGVEAVSKTAGDLDIDILEGISSFVSKNLLRQVEAYSEGINGEPRFSMLETIRKYGLEQLRESGEEEEIRQHHTEFYLALAEKADPELRGRDQLQWLDRLELEHDNLRAALEWSLEGGVWAWSSLSESTDVPLRLAATLWTFWYMSDYLVEGGEWLEKVLSIRTKSAQRSSARTKVLIGAGFLAHLQGDYDRATARFNEGLSRSRESGDKWGIAYSLNGLGAVARIQGDLGRATPLLEESLALSREIEDKVSIAWSLRFLGLTESNQGNYDRALRLLEESMTRFREMEDKISVSYTLPALSYVVLKKDDYNRALELLEENLTLARELGEKGWMASALHRLGNMALLQEDYGRAAELLKESLSLLDERSKRNIAWCLEDLAGVAVGQGQQGEAARFYGAAEVLRHASATPMPPSDREIYDRRVDSVRAGLGEEAFASAWKEGQTMSVEESIKYALES